MTIVIIFFSEWKASVVFNILKTFENWPLYSTKNDISHHGTFWDFSYVIKGILNYHIQVKTKLLQFVRGASWI